MMTNTLGIFFGSDTGNTEKIAHLIQKEFGSENANVFDIFESNKEELEAYDRLIFGISTWYYGEPQCDWDDFLPTLKKINFSGKKIAIFGCGDQEDYADYFCDAMFILYSIVKSNGGTLVGSWPTIGYYFQCSKSILNNRFIGLAIDEDRQPDITERRIKDWVKQISKEFGFT